MLFTDLSQYTDAKLTCGYSSKNNWQKVDYLADDISGTMLFANECCFPEPLELNLGVQGKFDVYLCIAPICGANTLLEVKLANAKFKTTVTPSDLQFVRGNLRWQSYEYAEEVYLGAFDLTNESIIINKPSQFQGPVNRTPLSSALLYIRLENHVAEHEGANQIIQYHFDCDFVGEIDAFTAEDYLGRFEMAAQRNCDAMITEVMFDDLQPQVAVYHRQYYEKFNAGFAQYQKFNAEIKKKLVDLKKQHNFKLYGGYRMGAGNFVIPYSPFLFIDDFEQFPDSHCVQRNGKPAAFLSYAYPEVRQMMIRRILANLPSDFDGVSLFFHRCPAIALFEKPVCDQVKNLYGIDARLLPFADPRLHAVIGSYGTMFLRELKLALDTKKPGGYKINVILFYDVESSKQFGYDVETWLQEGLVHSVSQGLMKYYEDTSDLLHQNGQIDLDKYYQKEKFYPVIKRIYSGDLDLILPGALGFKKLCDRYNVDFYGALPWESNANEDFFDIAQALRAHGIQKLICWNGNHIIKRLSKLEAVKMCGDAQPTFDLRQMRRRTLRITNLDGRDFSEFDINWKG
ncbi:MAG: hypothetical protein ACOX3K_05235 [Bacilli bacterium]